MYFSNIVIIMQLILVKLLSFKMFSTEIKIETKHYFLLV